MDTGVQENRTSVVRERNLLKYMPKTHTDLRLNDLLDVYNMIDEIYGKKV